MSVFAPDWEMWLCSADPLANLVAPIGRKSAETKPLITSVAIAAPNIKARAPRLAVTVLVPERPKVLHMPLTVAQALLGEIVPFQPSPNYHQHRPHARAT